MPPACSPGELGVGGAGEVDGQAPGVSQVGHVAEEFQGVQEPPSRLHAPPDAAGHPCPRTRREGSASPAPSGGGSPDRVPDPVDLPVVLEVPGHGQGVLAVPGHAQGQGAQALAERR